MTSEEIKEQSRQILADWLESCRSPQGKFSRNTVAIGVVVLNHLLRASPVSRTEVLSPRGEVKGARSALGGVLEKHGIPRSYLKEVTTRQAPQDGRRLFEQLDWGAKLALLPDEERKGLLAELIGSLKQLADDDLQRENLKLDIDRRQAPATWINLIVENAEGRSGGIVEQHLVGAKLSRRFRGITIQNHPAHAGDQQTDRAGDFATATTIYHVTGSPGRRVIEKCAQNVRAGGHPVLLVPRKQVDRARYMAEEEGVDQQLTIASIEEFVGINIIELATEENKDFFTVLQEIVEIYNRRLSEVETDLSLQIEVR